MRPLTTHVEHVEREIMYLILSVHKALKRKNNINT
jgi:hypothetical protein